MRGAGVLIVALGVLILFAGLGMDTTETTRTCYEADYSWDAADSSGCVETTYHNPAPKIAATMLGLGVILAGVFVLSQADGSGILDDSPTNPSSGAGSSTTETAGHSFADQLRDRQDQERSE